MPRVESHVRLDPQKVLAALQVRGQSAAAFAKESHVSAATLSAILHHGRPVNPHTARKIAAALTKTAALPALKELIADDSAGAA